MAKEITPRAQDYAQWYQDLVIRAGLADYSAVRGCMVIKPYGFAIWERMRDALDAMFKETGHQNAYFPLFIPKSFFSREAAHVDGFAKECAVVTHYRLRNGQDGQIEVDPNAKLEEELVVRPTSETIIWNSYRDWIQSYRDLPLLINQWANVVRWEMRTRPFLRTTEFLWQEGHTAHATYEEAEARTLQMLDIYTDFAVNEAAIPVIKGRKSERERFAGALKTYTIEAMMRDGKALQSGTSHNLGQNFAKAFDIQYLDPANERRHVWTTSWGLSTRMVGAIIMAHGDDKGLRLPPRVAPIQVVAIPIYKDADQRSQVMPTFESLVTELKEAGIRVHVDDRDLSPGFKYNDWEMRGVPVRMEIGPKDVEKESAVLARRDVAGKEGKRFVPQANFAQQVQDLLREIQTALLEDATAFRDQHIIDVADLDTFKQVIESGNFARVWWNENSANELHIKEETSATLRCYPFEQPGGNGKDLLTGESADRVALFAKAY